MALEIKSTPVLESEAAVIFSRKIEQNQHKKATIDFSEQVSVSRKILEKAEIDVSKFKTIFL